MLESTIKECQVSKTTAKSNQKQGEQKQWLNGQRCNSLINNSMALAHVG